MQSARKYFTGEIFYSFNILNCFYSGRKKRFTLFAIIRNKLENFCLIFQNKFYIETKLNRDLKDDLIKLFTEHVAEKHIYNLMRK